MGGIRMPESNMLWIKNQVHEYHCLDLRKWTNQKKDFGPQTGMSTLDGDEAKLKHILILSLFGPHLLKNGQKWIMRRRPIILVFHQLREYVRQRVLTYLKMSYLG